MKVGFGGGCHWCTEAVFQALRGVEDVAQGFVRSVPPDDGWSEAVLVTLDPDAIDLATLVEIHLRTHASTSAHKMRGKYRSVVYAMGMAQSAALERVLAEMQGMFEAPLVTRVLPFEGFKPSDARFHDYYRSDPSRPFCRTYIDPKLAMLRKVYSEQLSDQVPQNV